MVYTLFSQLFCCRWFLSQRVARFLSWRRQSFGISVKSHWTRLLIRCLFLNNQKIVFVATAFDGEYVECNWINILPRPFQQRNLPVPQPVPETHPTHCTTKCPQAPPRRFFRHPWMTTRGPVFELTTMALNWSKNCSNRTSSWCLGWYRLQRWERTTLG